MIIIINSQGGVVSIQDEDFFQGSTKLNNIYLIAPFSDSVTFKAMFEMPDGRLIPSNLDGFLMYPSVKVTHNLNSWKMPITFPITQDYGMVSMQIRGTIGDTVVCTTTVKLPIQRGIPYASDYSELPDKEQLLQLIADLRANLSNKVDKVYNSYTEVESGSITPETEGIYYTFNIDTGEYIPHNLPQDYDDTATYYKLSTTTRIGNNDNGLYFDFVDNENETTLRLKVENNKVTINNKQVVVIDDLVAQNISYDNASSGLEAENVKDAIDELNQKETSTETNLNLLTNEFQEFVEDQHNIDASQDSNISNLRTRVQALENRPAVSGVVVKDLEIETMGDDVTIKTTKLNLGTQEETEDTKSLLLANDNNAGLMSYEDYQQLRQNTEDIGKLKGKTTRLLYTDKTNPTAQEINAFVISEGYVSPFTGVSVIVNTTYHIWHYYENDDIGWKDDGIDTVNQFTNEYAGVIKGTNADGKVYAETDGTGSVYGWNVLKSRVSTNEDNIAKLTPIISTEAPTSETVGEIGQLYLNTTTSELFVLDEIDTEGNYIWVTVDNGMKQYILTYNGTNIQHNAENVNYETIRNACLNTKYFVYMTYSNLLYIPVFITADAVEFASNYISGNYQRTQRIIINSQNIIKVDNIISENTNNKLQDYWDYDEDQGLDTYFCAKVIMDNFRTTEQVQQMIDNAVISAINADY